MFEQEENGMKKHGIKKIIKMSAVAVGIMGITAASSFGADFVSVVKDGVNLRSGPETKYEILFQLPSGYPLKVLSRKGKWIKISDYENDKGWIYSTLVNSTPHVIVRAKECNVRSGPGTNHGKVGSVARDVILRKLESKGDWVKVSHPQISGWVYGKLVWP